MRPQIIVDNSSFEAAEKEPVLKPQVIVPNDTFVPEAHVVILYRGKRYTTFREVYEAAKENSYE